MRRLSTERINTHLESTECYRLLDDIVVIGEYTLVRLAMEDLRGIVVSILLSAP